MTTLALTLNFYHFSTATPTLSYPGCQGDMTCQPSANVIPRVLKRLGQRVVAGGDSGVMEKLI